MDRRRKWLIVSGLVLAAVVALLQATRWALDSTPAIIAFLVAVLVAGYGMRPIGPRSKSHPRTGGPSMNDVPKDLWEPVGETGHFRRALLPMSETARLLPAGGFRHILYGEYDTDSEPEAWHDFLYDPLKVLIAEGIVGETPEDEHHSHLHVTIYKLTGPASEDEAYRSEVGQRGDHAARVYASATIADGARRAWHVGTTVVNHEQPLNPRIGMTTVLM
jgi:hypothetical protein